MRLVDAVDAWSLQCSCDIVSCNVFSHYLAASSTVCRVPRNSFNEGVRIVAARVDHRVFVPDTFIQP